MFSILSLFILIKRYWIMCVCVCVCVCVELGSGLCGQ